jgi:hypothetical protein
MSRVLPLVAALALGLVPLTARAADEPKDVLARAIKAHGGEEVLTKNKASQVKSKGKITLPMLGEVDFTQEVSTMLPDKFRDTLTITVNNTDVTILTIANGDDISIEAAGNKVDVPDEAKAQLKAAGHMTQVGRLVPLKDAKKYELSLIGEDKVEGKKVVGILVKAKDQKDISMYFDKETGLLAKMEFRGSEPGTNKEVNEERFVSEYGKNKDGVPVPKKIVVKHDGKTFLDAEVTELLYLEKLDDSVFKK